MFLQDFVVRTAWSRGAPPHDGRCAIIMRGRECAFTLFRCLPSPPIRSVAFAAFADRIGPRIVGDCICYYLETRHNDPRVRSTGQLRITRVSLISHDEETLRVIEEKPVRTVPSIVKDLLAFVLLYDLAFVVGKRLLQKRLAIAPPVVFDQD